MEHDTAEVSAFSRYDPALHPDASEQETDAVALEYCQLAGAPDTDTEGLKVSPASTVKLTESVLVNPPPVPLIVMVNVPVWALPVVEIVKVLEQVGVQDAGLNEAVAPLPSPETENVTDELNPFDAVVSTVYVVEFPRVTVRVLGSAESEKSGAGRLMVTVIGPRTAPPPDPPEQDEPSSLRQLPVLSFTCNPKQ